MVYRGAPCARLDEGGNGERPMDYDPLLSVAVTLSESAMWSGRKVVSDGAVGVPRIWCVLDHGGCIEGRGPRGNQEHGDVKRAASSRWSGSHLCHQLREVISKGQAGGTSVLKGWGRTQHLRRRGKEGKRDGSLEGGGGVANQKRGGGVPQGISKTVRSLLGLGLGKTAKALTTDRRCRWSVCSARSVACLSFHHPKV